MKSATELADYLADNARRDEDIKAAQLLRRLGRLHDVAQEMVKAKPGPAKNAAYAELVDLLHGRER